MKLLRIALLFTLLIPPSFASGQASTDSLELVGIPRWIHWRAIKEIKTGRACDSLRVELEKELALSVKVEAFADSLLSARDRQLALKILELNTSELRRANQTAYTQEVKREVKKWKWITGGVGLLLLLALL